MGTKRYSLTSYINKMESLYSKAREDYVRVANEFSRNEERHKKALNSGELSSKGIENENDRYYFLKKTLQQRMADIRADFQKGAGEIRNNVDSLFKKNYRVNSDDIDLKAIEILKSGMLSDAELLEMAYNYKEQGNLAMFKYCGTIADKDKMNPAMKQLAGEARLILQRADLSVVDSFTEICLKGLRDDVLLANGIDERHDELCQELYSEANGITTTVTTPWDTE